MFYVYVGQVPEIKPIIMMMFDDDEGERKRTGNEGWSGRGP